MNPVVIKLSGNIIADKNAMDKISGAVRQYISDNIPVVIVHGGGKQINELSSRLQLPVRQISGRRVTDESALEVMLYTVGGRANRHLVSHLRKNGIASTGISGIDGNITTAYRRPPLDIDGVPIDFGLVGEIESVDATLLKHLISGGYVPVIGCLTWSPEEGILNINADTFAIRISLGLEARELIILMDPPAVLDAEQKPIAGMTREDWQRGLIEGWVRNGMKPKLLTAFEALENGVASVKLANADSLASGGGTRLIPGRRR